ncbi:MAG: amino acid permease, partial [Candidatus Eremiobacteraeota bacterium]|nr:amino acid permease [Candidatus Eremiobacteraeota bacterium]
WNCNPRRPDTSIQSSSPLVRRLGVVDLTLITVGAVIGSGIFRTPAIVAQRVHQPGLIVACWIAGGALALIGAFVFAELAARRPLDGGLYAYLRDAYHPAVGFVFAWSVFWIAYTGGTAASAVLFATYLGPALGIPMDPRWIAVAAMACVTAVNVLGVRQGATWQNLLVILKLGAVAALIVAAFVAHPIAHAASPHVQLAPIALLGALGVAMLPVLFAYNGFQTATYISVETRQPERTMPRGIVLGVTCVVVVYVLVSTGCLRVLGVDGLASSSTPAADVMHAAMGVFGSRAIAIAIAISTLGYMSSGILLGPRLYYQVARDGLAPRAIAWVAPRTRVPVVAILMHGGMSAAIAASGTYEQIVNWVTAPDWAFVMLAAAAIFVFRKRDAGVPRPPISVPGHPWTTAALIVVLLGIFVSEIAVYPHDTLYGGIVLLSGAVFYGLWRGWSNRRERA